jgi:hypothetical protein
MIYEKQFSVAMKVANETFPIRDEEELTKIKFAWKAAIAAVKFTLENRIKDVKQGIYGDIRAAELQALLDSLNREEK